MVFRTARFWGYVYFLLTCISLALGQPPTSSRGGGPRAACVVLSQPDPLNAILLHLAEERRPSGSRCRVPPSELSFGVGAKRTLKDLAMSMPRRIKAVLKNDGGPPKY